MLKQLILVCPPEHRKRSEKRTFLVLDLLLDIVNGVGRLHLEGDGLSGKGLNENLHFPISVVKRTTGTKKKS
jgi:hypothetical protein